MRAQRKAKEEQEEIERKKRKEAEEEEKRREKEEEERRRKEKEDKEKEEFAKWKDFIEVESEGSMKEELAEKQARMAGFADHVKREKVVLLEDLATTFGLQTQVCALLPLILYLFFFLHQVLPYLFTLTFHYLLCNLLSLSHQPLRGYKCRGRAMVAPQSPWPAPRHLTSLPHYLFLSFSLSLSPWHIFAKAFEKPVPLSINQSLSKKHFKCKRT